MSTFTDTGIDRTTTLKISGMTCAHCVDHVTEELKNIAGVKDVSIILHVGADSIATVVSDIRLADADLENAIDEAGAYTLTSICRDEA